jgi:predicted CoA-binding protein
VFLNKKNVFAVVGASCDPRKYGYQVYKDLKNAGYEVYPVNPNAQEILGDKYYPSLEKLPVKPDVVDVVVPPKVTEHTVETCIDRSIDQK